jgi:TolB protein
MMRKMIHLLFFMMTAAISCSAHAILSMELTRGMAGAIPIAVVPFEVVNETPSQDVSGIVSHDLQNSGRFKVSSHHANIDNVVRGNVTAISSDRYQVSFQLLDNVNGQGSVVLSKKYTVSGRELRAVAHHISDMVYQQLTGVKGIFSTRIAYVVVQRYEGARARYILEVSDQDGYNPRPLLSSYEPIMSPSWSPNGRQIAYVSFEGKRAGIYLEDVSSGGRRLLSSFPGINGAPAWSRDGRKLALVLSKSGSPNIYVMDIASRSLTQMTHDFYINTEPSWAPDGRSLIFTSNRGGGVQVYQINLGSRAVSRVSYDGDYNARASYTHDGNHITMIHRVSGVYKIAILDLDSGTTRVLTNASGDSSSPSIAPNGSMILYDTVLGGRNVLGMVSSDGRVELTLPARNGEAQDPSWSPF